MASLSDRPQQRSQGGSERGSAPAFWPSMVVYGSKAWPGDRRHPEVPASSPSPIHRHRQQPSARVGKAGLGMVLPAWY